MSNEMDLPPPIFAVLNLENPSDRKNSETSIYFRWNDQDQQAAAQLGFRNYNHVLEFAAKLAPNEISINVLDRHPSAKTHQIYADKLFEMIASDVIASRLCLLQSSQQPQPVVNAPLADRRLMRVKLGDNIRFLGHKTDFKSDKVFELTFGWQTLAQVDTDNSIFIYLRDGDGQRRCRASNSALQRRLPHRLLVPSNVNAARRKYNVLVAIGPTHAL